MLTAVALSAVGGVIGGCAIGYLFGAKAKSELVALMADVKKALDAVKAKL